MNVLAESYWTLFAETGAPEYYLCYREALAAEGPAACEKTA